MIGVGIGGSCSTRPERRGRVSVSGGGGEVTPDFYDGFESGNFLGATGGSWYGTGGSVASDNPYAGTYAHRYTFPGEVYAEDSSVEARFSITTPLSELWWEYRIHIPSNYDHRTQLGTIATTTCTIDVSTAPKRVVCADPVFAGAATVCNTNRWQFDVITGAGVAGADLVDATIDTYVDDYTVDLVDNASTSVTDAACEVGTVSGVNADNNKFWIIGYDNNLHAGWGEPGGWTYRMEILRASSYSPNITRTRMVYGNHEIGYSSDFGQNNSDAFITESDLGTWMLIGIHLKLATTIADSDGECQLYKNGSLLVSNTGLPVGGTLSSTPADSFEMMGWANSGYDVQTIFDIDEVKIYSSNPGTAAFGG